MKKLINKIATKANQMVRKAKQIFTAMVCRVSLLPFRAKAAVSNARGEGFVDTAIFS